MAFIRGFLGEAVRRPPIIVRSCRRALLSTKATRTGPFFLKPFTPKHKRVFRQPLFFTELLHGDSAAPLLWAISSAHPSTCGLVVLSSMRVSHMKPECSAGQQMRKS